MNKNQFLVKTGKPYSGVKNKSQFTTVSDSYKVLDRMKKAML